MRRFGVRVWWRGPVPRHLRLDCQRITWPAASPWPGPAQLAGGAVAEPRLDEEFGILAVRALNAVGALPAILDAMDAVGVQPGDVRVRKNPLESVLI